MERSWHFENARVLKDDFTFEVTSLTVRDGVIEGIGGRWKKPDPRPH